MTYSTRINVRSNLDGFRAEHVDGAWLQADHKGKTISLSPKARGLIRDLMECEILARIRRDEI